MRRRLEPLIYRLPAPLRSVAFRLTLPGTWAHWQRMRREMTDDGYSYQPFDERRCIFVHVPKCAGISVCRALFGNLAGGHADVRRYRVIFGATRFSRYFKFTFVRNPWDRVVSAYTFLKQGGMNERDRAWAKSHLVDYPDFDSFVTGWLSPESARSQLHFRPQLDFLCERSPELLVDFVGYFETLESDFDKIRERLGCGDELPKTNQSNRREDYREYYSARTKEIVARVYRDDIHALGYDFDGIAMRSALGHG